MGGMELKLKFKPVFHFLVTFFAWKTKSECDWVVTTSVFRLPLSCYPFFVFLIPFRLKHSYTTMGTLSNGWTLEPNNFQTQRYRTFFRKWISNCLLGFTVIVIDDTDIYVYLSSFFRIWVCMKLNQIAQMLGKIRKTARKTDTAMCCHVSLTVLCALDPRTLAQRVCLLSREVIK